MGFKYCSAILIWMLLSIPFMCRAQDKKFNVTGRVVDSHKQPIGGVIVHVLNTDIGVQTDSNGRYKLDELDLRLDTICFEALGYKPFSVIIRLESDKVINATLPDDKTELGNVVISGHKSGEIHTVATSTLTGTDLFRTRGESLGESLKEIPGLNSVQTGPTMSKPVIHGLHSNRVLIMNNGVRQEGQQWGSEHAPEIDPFVANKISVVKGAASVRYGSDAIGGVVLLGPDDMPRGNKMSGDVYLVGATNGQMGAFSTMLQGALDSTIPGLSWRVQGTTKMAGNFKTPDYYLLNTGLREGDFTANVAYRIKRFEFNVYYSQYNTLMGIFLGAESGSPADLLLKFAAGRPFLPSYFTYNFERPYQTVYHDMMKGIAGYTFGNSGKLELTFARQNDIRKEYDADLNNPAEYNLPQLSFQLITHSLDLVYTEPYHKGFSGSFGFTGTTSGNVFEGARYLIPNFRDYNGGAFLIERYQYGKMTLEAGLRDDYRWLRVYERNSTTLGLYNTTYNYDNYSGTVGATYRHDKHLSASFNIGTAWRAPSINEMYINGEHFSDARFELGDSSLKSERALNTGLSINYTAKKVRIIVDLYNNYINNYIYSKPTLTTRVLPSGAFPLFQYVQTNANIQGMDATLQYDVTPRLSFQSKTTIVRGYNKTTKEYLIYMPADMFENGLTYNFGKFGTILEPYISLENELVLKQTRVPANSDFVSPPSGYYIFNANTGCTFLVNKRLLNVNIAVTNFTNAAYRDYLDHYRYYCDNLGINYVLRLKYSF